MKDRQRILWVQPDLLVRKRLEREMDGLGFELVSCHDGVLGLREFRTDPFGFDGAILDVELPDLPAVELAGHLHRVCANLPVVFVGEGRGRPADLCDGGGPLAFEPRPLRPRDIAARLRGLALGARPRRPIAA